MNAVIQTRPRTGRPGSRRRNASRAFSRPPIAALIAQAQSDAQAVELYRGALHEAGARVTARTRRAWADALLRRPDLDGATAVEVFEGIRAAGPIPAHQLGAWRELVEAAKARPRHVLVQS